jgi:hypothetical protein
MNQRIPKTENNRPAARTEWPKAFPFKDAEELTATAQALHAHGFANPQRLGCPAPGTLQAVVQARQLPAEELRAHLFGCSECFNEYRAAILAQRQQATTTSVTWRDKLAAVWWGWRTLVLVNALVLLVLGLGIFIRNAREEIAPQISQSRPPSLPTTDIEQRAETATGVRSSVQPTPQIQPVLTPKALKTDEQSSKSTDLPSINIDLNNYSSMSGVSRREGSDQAEKIIELPRARVQLKLKLPRESAPGRYQVNLVDDYLRSIAPGQVISADSSHLAVKLDLRRLGKRFYHLSLARGDEAPYFYRVVITVP